MISLINNIKFRYSELKSECLPFVETDCLPYDEVSSRYLRTPINLYNLKRAVVLNVVQRLFLCAAESEAVV